MGVGYRNKYILLIMIICMFLCACTRDNEKVGNAHLNVIRGKVVEVISENQVKVEMTSNSGGYKKGEQFIISFQEVKSVVNYENLKNYEVQVDDEVTAQFASIDGEIDGCDYVEVKYLGIICEEESTCC